MLKDAAWAKREALARKRDQGGLNPVETLEFAYSPNTGAVGCRSNFQGIHTDGGSFRVFNLNYPMYGRNDEVTDWVSVGIAR